MHSLNDDLSFAHRLADEARRLAMARFGGPLHERTKSDGSLVTDADEAVEDAVLQLIARERRADAVLAEERGASGSGPRRWLIDGIDGTEQFAKGRPEWSILLALEIDGRVALGMCDQPAQGGRYWAVEGHGALEHHDGAKHRPTKMSVSTRDQLSSARALLPPTEWLKTDVELRAATRLRNATRPCQQTDHPAVQVARGECDCALFVGCGPWDLAAPSIIVEEAGGRFSSLEADHSFGAGAGLFTNGRVHDLALAEVHRPPLA